MTEEAPVLLEHASVGLRFVKRDGRFILQQRWLIYGEVPKYEWRDVPVEEEGT